MNIEQDRRRRKVQERAAAMRAHSVMHLEDDQLGSADQAQQIAMHVIAKAARKD